MLGKLLAALAILSVEALPECRHNEFLPPYHRTTHCEGQEPEHLREHRRYLEHDRLLREGVGATRVPNERTIVCPEHPATLYPAKGLDRKWIVENNAITPVTLSLVLSNGEERSALKPEDPSHVTLLYPSQFLAVDSFEGYVYHVRELEFNEEGKGPLLLQHQVGLATFWSPYRFDCTLNVTQTRQRQLVDPKTGEEHTVQELITTPQQNDVEPIDEQNPEERPPQFQRTQTQERPCNTLDIGFRNLVNCPLHVYWAANLVEIPKAEATCAESFRFHLGLHPQPQDFYTDWQSATKWEGTYISHTFVARLASQPNVVVDSYTVEPTRVMNCPQKPLRATATTAVPLDVTIAKHETTASPSSNNTDWIARLQLGTVCTNHRCHPMDP